MMRYRDGDYLRIPPVGDWHIVPLVLFAIIPFCAIWVGGVIYLGWLAIALVASGSALLGALSAGAMVGWMISGFAVLDEVV